MTQPIPHLRHVGPRDAGVGVDDIGRHRLGCLADDLEAPFDGATQHHVLVERIASPLDDRRDLVGPP
jgi:hypothetical protein